MGSWRGYKITAFDGDLARAVFSELGRSLTDRSIPGGVNP